MPVVREPALVAGTTQTLLVSSGQEQCWASAMPSPSVQRSHLVPDPASVTREEVTAKRGRAVPREKGELRTADSLAPQRKRASARARPRRRRGLFRKETLAPAFSGGGDEALGFLAPLLKEAWRGVGMGRCAGRFWRPGQSRDPQADVVSLPQSAQCCKVP